MGRRADGGGNATGDWTLRVRRAKIVATLGPALDDEDQLAPALEAGIDIVRLNFSHGEHDTHAKRLNRVRELAGQQGRNVASLADLQGPKIRLGVVPSGGVRLEDGGQVVLVPGREHLESHVDADGTPALPVTYHALAQDVQPGALVLVDDGLIRLVVSRTDGETVVARVVVGGRAESRKGVNLPGVRVSAPSLTDKDAEDLQAAVELGVDWVALSFVRHPGDLDVGRQRVADLGGEAPIVAKLERSEAIENLANVVQAADAVMVARGDLGVEIGSERVPAIQKEIIHRGNDESRPAITATEMLESMLTSPRPTRAEASDVANAVFDGSDALMLSGETAVGHYPVESVRTMARIIEVAESSPHLIHPQPPHLGEREIRRVVASSACRVAEDVGATALAVFSITGGALQLVSTFRPPVPIVGLTPSELTRRRSAMLWGTEAVLVPMKDQAGDLIEAAERMLSDGGWVSSGDRLVILSGLPRAGGSTNRILVHTVGTEPV